MEQLRNPSLLRALTSTLLLLAHASAFAPGESVDQDLVGQLDKLYYGYLGGDIVQARENLRQSILLLDGARFSKPAASAHGLWITHSRLAVLEGYAGNAILAEANLLKARFWYLRKFEISGESTEEAMKAVHSYDADKCRQAMEKFDKTHTNGLGPKYSRKE